MITWLIKSWRSDFEREPDEKATKVLDNAIQAYRRDESTLDADERSVRTDLKELMLSVDWDPETAGVLFGRIMKVRQRRMKLISEFVDKNFPESIQTISEGNISTKKIEPFNVWLSPIGKGPMDTVRYLMLMYDIWHFVNDPNSNIYAVGSASYNPYIWVIVLKSGEYLRLKETPY